MIKDLVLKDIKNKLNNNILLEIGEGKTRIVYEYLNYVIKVDKFNGKYNEVEYKLFQEYKNNKIFLNSFIECYCISDDSKILVCEKLKPLIEYLNEIDKLILETKCIEEVSEILGFKVNWEYIYNLCQKTGLALEEVYDCTNYAIRDNTFVVMDYAEFI